MNLNLNMQLKLTIEDGYLCVKLVSKGDYPWYEERVEEEALLSLTELKSALENE